MTWTVGDRVAVCVLKKRPIYYTGQVGLTTSNLGTNNYVSDADAERIPEEGGLFVLERILEKQRVDAPEWRLVTDE